MFVVCHFAGLALGAAVLARRYALSAPVPTMGIQGAAGQLPRDLTTERTPVISAASGDLTKRLGKVCGGHASTIRGGL